MSALLVNEIPCPTSRNVKKNNVNILSFQRTQCQVSVGEDTASRERREKIEESNHLGSKEQVMQQRDEKEGQRTDDDDPKELLLVYEHLKKKKKTRWFSNYGFYLMVKKKKIQE